jgi:hypothetical protein
MVASETRELHNSRGVVCAAWRGSRRAFSGPSEASRGRWGPDSFHQEQRRASISMQEVEVMDDPLGLVWVAC